VKINQIRTLSVERVGNVSVAPPRPELASVLEGLSEIIG